MTALDCSSPSGEKKWQSCHHFCSPECIVVLFFDCIQPAVPQITSRWRRTTNKPFIKALCRGCCQIQYHVWIVDSLWYGSISDEYLQNEDKISKDVSFALWCCFAHSPFFLPTVWICELIWGTNINLTLIIIIIITVINSFECTRVSYKMNLTSIKTTVMKDPFLCSFRT